MARHEHGRGARDAAGVGPYVREGARLESIRHQTWQIADGSADVRGWEVRTLSGREVGRVQDLLVDPELREVVLLDVDLAGTTARGLVPLRAAQIDRDARVILVDSADVRDEADFETYGVGARARAEPTRQRVMDAPVVPVATVAPVSDRVVEAQPVVSQPVAPPAPRGDVVVEEVVVRRRVVDAAEADALPPNARVVGAADDPSLVRRPDGLRVERVRDDRLDDRLR
jgi:hypothetical protein